MNRNFLIFFVVHILLMGVVADQASKAWAFLSAMEPRILVPGYLAAYSARNPGAILGFASGQHQISTLLACLGFFFAGLLVGVAYAERYRPADWIALALVVSGIFGNTIDRLALGHVRDFLVPWLMPRIAFNLADVFMVVGFTALLVSRCCDRKRIRRGLVASARAAA